MIIKLSHVTDFYNCTDIHLYISSEDNNNYFEKMFGLSKESGRYLVIHAKKEKSSDGSYPYSAFIEGTIYDKNGEVCIVPNRVFHEDDIGEINCWVDQHENEWMNAIEK